MPVVLAGVFKGLTKHLPGTKAHCPFPCQGILEEIIPDRGEEIATPNEFKQQKQFHCKLCGADFIGISLKAVSKTKPNWVQIRAWRSSHSHGKWEKNFRGKITFAGFW